MSSDRTPRVSLRWVVPLALAVGVAAVYVAFTQLGADTGQPAPTTTSAAAAQTTSSLAAEDLTTTTPATATTTTTTAPATAITTTTASATTLAEAPATATAAPAASVTDPDETPASPAAITCEDGHHAHDGECHPDPVTEPAEGGDDVQPSTEVVWWRPGLGDEAFALLDPDQAGADHVILMAEDRKWGTYRYYLFYHGMVEGSAAEADLFWDVGETFRRIHQEATLWVYYPYRYDLAWVDYPTVMEVTATFPLGEAVVVVFHRDGQYWAGEWDGVEFPTGPPIRPTTPFAEPRYPDTAQALGRDCPPVEDLWEQGKDVTDPCTTAAVATALDYAYTAPTPMRMAALRDGHVLDGVFAFQDNIDDPFYARFYVAEGRAERLFEIEAMRWAGSFAQASMILVEYRSGWSPWEMTDEQRQAAATDYELRVEYLRSTYPDYKEPARGLEGLINFFEEGGMSDQVHETLMVRTADGTWRLSYRAFCAQWIVTGDWSPVLANRVICPADPTPWFPDSDVFDTDIYPPNHLWYYNDPRELGDFTHPVWTYDRGGMDKHRLAGEYLGVPPS